MDYEVIRRVVEAFDRHEVAYAVFGAAALNFHGLARFTEDLDLFVAPTEDNVARMKRALQEVFDDPSIDEISAEDLLGDYPAVQYVPPSGDFHLDILTRLGDMFRYEDLDIERIPWDGLEVRVVSARTLYRMKKDTVRLKDRADAELLRERFDLEDDD